MGSLKVELLAPVTCVADDNHGEVCRVIGNIEKMMEILYS